MAMTKSQRLARKRRFAELPGLTPSRKRGKDKCFIERTRQQMGPPEPDAREVVLSARCRHLDRPDTEENRLAVSWSILGDPAGRAISLGATGDNEDDRKRDQQRMWDTFISLDRAVAAYHHRILRQNRFAKCGKTEFIPERFETRDDEHRQTDARDEVTKDRDTISAWMRWHGYVMQLDRSEQTIIWDAVWLRRELTKGASLTVSGQSFVRAMRTLAAIVNGR